MAKYNVQVRRPVHGTGAVPIQGSPVDWAGGIFGGPPLPAGRSGIFRTHWALDFPNRQDAGSLAPYTGANIPGTVMYENDYLTNPGGALTGFWSDRTMGEKWLLASAAALGAFLLLKKFG
jgi:hypothetical protein